jgi:hypothetical protein
MVGVRTGIEVAVAIGLVGDQQRHLRRQIDQHAGIELEIGVDRPDLHAPASNQLGELAALRPGEGEVEPIGDAALEYRQMIRQREHRLHHMQVMHARRIDLGQRRGEKVGLLLVVALDRHAIAGLDHGFQQFDHAVGGANLSVAAKRGCTREPGQSMRPR